MCVTYLRFFCLLVCLFGGVVQAAESDELALIIKQLDQVQAGLERARVVAAQSGEASRFYFDYQRATKDISAIRLGIGRYLEPSRAQPILSNAISGNYLLETPR